MSFVQHTSYTVIALLIFALLVQNTCPRGFAGKSTMLASCSHCPHKEMTRSHSENGQLSIISNRPVHMPMFVLEMPNPQPAVQLVPVASLRPVISNRYKKTLPDELLRPPHV